jgi:putative chitinase
MASLTDDILKKIMPHASKAKRQTALPLLTQTALAYNITTERRLAAWLATIAQESGELQFQEEIASGAAYEGRLDLGNTQKGDGKKFKGHGRIQITGRGNHTAYTKFLKNKGHLPFVDFVAEPKKLATEPYATDAAGWFWSILKKLNGLADAGDFLTTQIRVNGRNKKTGLPNHWKERNNFFVSGLSALPDGFILTK